MRVASVLAMCSFLCLCTAEMRSAAAGNGEDIMIRIKKQYKAYENDAVIDCLEECQDACALGAVITGMGATTLWLLSSGQPYFYKKIALTACSGCGFCGMKVAENILKRIRPGIEKKYGLRLEEDCQKAEIESWQELFAQMGTKLNASESSFAKKWLHQFMQPSHAQAPFLALHRLSPHHSDCLCINGSVHAKDQ